VSNVFPEPPYQRDFTAAGEAVDPVWQKWFFDLTAFMRKLAPVGSAAGHTIQDEAVNLAQKDYLDFEGAGVTAANSGVRTVITIPGDPWTYVKLAADFGTDSATPVNVPGLSFTPAVGKEYVVEAFLLTQSSDVAVGVKPGVSWPTGLTDGAARLDSTNGATSTAILNNNFNAAGSVSGTDMPGAAQSYPATLVATMLTGAAAAGNFQITLSRE